MDWFESRNAEAWNRLARDGSRFAQPAGNADFAKRERMTNPFGWLPDGVAGRRVLCLAAGGGKHGPLFAAAGADVTVVDVSEAMLELDRRASKERGITLRLVQASMTDLRSLADGEFDLVIQPVSTCYVADLSVVYREVSRVLRLGGDYLSQHKQPVSLQCEAVSDGRAMEIRRPYQEGLPLPESGGAPHREPGTVEFLHTLESLLGGLCKAGFAILDMREPPHGEPTANPGSFAYRSRFVPPYVAIKARKLGTDSARGNSGLWIPPGHS